MLTLRLSIACLALTLPAAATPELDRLKDSRRQAVEAIREDRATGLADASKNYLEALRAANRKATSDGNIDLLRVLDREQKAIEQGGADPTPPDDLPKTLLVSRKNFLRAVEKLETDLDKRRQEIDRKHLAALAKLQPPPGSQPELAEKIEAEKQAVLAGIVGPISNLQTGIAGTRWQVIRKPADFWFFEADGRMYSTSEGQPNGNWKYSTPAADELTVHWSDNNAAHLKLGRDGKTLLDNDKPAFRLVRPPDTE